MLLFQGTASKTDVLTDIDFPVKVYKRQYSCIKAHGGFVSAWKSANDEVMKDFITTCGTVSEYSPTIVGHSLGGAMSLLACEDFYFRTGKKADVLTFGCPNVFWGNKSKQYVSSCCNTCVQYAQYNDFVPTVPLGYNQINKIKCGKKFNLFEFTFKSIEYHLGYGKIIY